MASLWIAIVLGGIAWLVAGFCVGVAFGPWIRRSGRPRDR
jgi:hypothetical protein